MALLTTKQGFIDAFRCCIIPLMKLNADVGEGIGDDKALFEWIDMANIACGSHAGGQEEMIAAADLAMSYGVAVGAHPGYPDRDGFGRRSMNLSFGEIGRLVIEQVQALDRICERLGTRVQYVKPHGALYHDMMARQDVYKAVLQAVAWLPGSRALMVMARRDDARDRKLASAHGVPLLFEAFADRAYTADGNLLDRTESGAVYKDPQRMVVQVTELSQHGRITSHCGKMISIAADTVCLHGDNVASIEAAKQIHFALKS